MNSYTYIKIDTFEYPLYQGDIRLRHPEIGEDFVLPEGYAEVEQIILPPINENQDYVRLAPELIDCKYYQKVCVKNLTLEELEQRKKIMEQFSPQVNQDTTLPGTPPDVIG